MSTHTFNENNKYRWVHRHLTITISIDEYTDI